MKAWNEKHLNGCLMSLLSRGTTPPCFSDCHLNQELTQNMDKIGTNGVTGRHI